MINSSQPTAVAVPRAISATSERRSATTPSGTSARLRSALIATNAHRRRAPVSSEGAGGSVALATGSELACGSKALPFAHDRVLGLHQIARTGAPPGDDLKSSAGSTGDPQWSMDNGLVPEGILFD